jgi:actin related protein 2/3 complex subunit 2
MFILQQYNVYVYEFLQRHFSIAKKGGSPERVLNTIPDFDGGQYYISNKNDDKNLIMISLNIRYYKELQSHGCDAFLRSHYSGYIQDTPEDGYNVSLVFDLTKLPEDIDALALKAAHLKRNCFASVFYKYFDIQAKLEKGEPAAHTRAVIHYRPNETLFIDAKSDRVTVIYSTTFMEDDAVAGKLFLQEFEQGRRSSQTAPQVLYRIREPPNELKDCKDALVGENVGYITFIFFPRHLTPANRDNTINLLHIFRDYLHYHIKCSKAFLHSRFRQKATEWLKVLNRAKP